MRIALFCIMAEKTKSITVVVSFYLRFKFYQFSFVSGYGNEC